jgi:hypothetical protein
MENARLEYLEIDGRIKTNMELRNICCKDDRRIELAYNSVNWRTMVL